MALSHLKVQDLTANLSGPYCAMILADQGADVINIERPDVGDDKRLTPPLVGGQTAHRDAETTQRNPGDWEVWTGQGPMNVHKREYLGHTDVGVILLRDMLRQGIRAVARGEDIAMPEGTPEKPFHTYGGDTILCIPKDNQDDRAMIDRVQYTVADIYFAGDTYEGEDRTANIRREVAAKFPS